MSGVGTPRNAENGRGRLPIARAQLVADNASHNPARNGPDADAAVTCSSVALPYKVNGLHYAIF